MPGPERAEGRYILFGLRVREGNGSAAADLALGREGELVEMAG